MARGREEDVEKEESPQPEAKKGSKRLIILAVAAVLVIGGIGGAYFLFFAKGGGGHGEGKAAKAEKSAEAEGGKTMLKNMDPFIVNLTDAQGTRYLKAVIQLEVNSELASQEIDEKVPAIRDDIISLLSSKSFEDIATEPGKRELKKSMLERINKNLKDGQVTHIFFTEFVVQ